MSQQRRTVKRFDELISDEEIEAAVQKYSLGAEIWWGRAFIELSREVVDPATGASLGKHVMPVMRIYLGMRGFLVGPENYIWWVIMLNVTPTGKLDEEIMSALEGMRQHKAQQAASRSR